MKRLHVHVRGRVQGVFFRAVTQETARGLNLTGWVRNRPDGSVEAVFEGENDPVDKMLAWCYQGPPTARVEEVLVQEEPYAGLFKNFDIQY
ncbi:MAG TPA: acylphosphatase [Smithella sp.]|nr:acylphosphatase [Smithella sp.]